MGHAKRKRNRKRQEREREQEQLATQTAQIAKQSDATIIKTPQEFIQECYAARKKIGDDKFVTALIAKQSNATIIKTPQELIQEYYAARKKIDDDKFVTFSDLVEQDPDFLDELFNHDSRLYHMMDDTPHSENYIQCFKRLRFLNQSLKIYGDLPEEDAILRKLLEMNLSPDSWRDSWNGDGYTPIEENYGLIVKMGHRLDYLGGSHLMRSILEDTYKRDWGRLDHAWSGIGNWLA